MSTNPTPISVDERIAELAAENYDLRTTFAEEYPGMWRMQCKIDRQRVALDRLNRRNATLRFALKVHEHLHGALTDGEWATARDTVSNEQHQARIDKAVPTAA
jgi:hypothetical protein